MLSSLVAQTVKVYLQCRRPGFDPWVRKIPWRRKWQPTWAIKPCLWAPDWILLLQRPRIPASFRGSATTFQLDHHKGHALDQDASQVLSLQPHPYPDHLSHQRSPQTFQLSPNHKLSTKRDLRATYARAWPKTCSGASVFFNQTFLCARLWKEQVQTPSQQPWIWIPILLLRNNGTWDKSHDLTGSTEANNSSYLRGLLWRLSEIMPCETLRR